jgi:hypothetical protein
MASLFQRKSWAWSADGEPLLCRYICALFPGFGEAETLAPGSSIHPRWIPPIWQYQWKLESAVLLS